MTKQRRGVGRWAAGIGVLCVVAILVGLVCPRDFRERARWWTAVARIAVEINTDESKVPEYRLPDPLLRSDGSPLASPGEWSRSRRGEILELFRKEVYGRSPGFRGPLRFTPGPNEKALEGLGIRRQVSIQLAGGSDAPTLDLLLYLPADPPNPAPVFLGLNFWGNHSIQPDPDIRLSNRWMASDRDRGVRNHRATEESRGRSQSRWPVEMILQRGYGVATVYYGDIEPDHPEGYGSGVRAHAPYEPGAAANTWGAVAAWSWGLSRALDYLERDADVDARKVIVFGHSRLGKAALWAAAQDERFAMAISNNSGCMGAALSRRRFGETVQFVNMLFPHWFPAVFHEYADREDELPVDQHMLLALIAPRPLYVASAEEDDWADPRGEFLAAEAASRVYRFLGGEGLDADVMPPIGEPVMSQLGYHIRAGGHDVTEYDWTQYLEFATRYLPASTVDIR